MANRFGTATLTSQSVIGVFDQATGRVLDPPLGTTNDATVPTSIDFAGAAEVTDALQAFCDAQPDGSRIIFQPAGNYYCDGTLTFKGRKNLLFDVNGATIKSKKKNPISTRLSGLTILAKGDKGIWANQPPASQSFLLGANEQLIYSPPAAPTLRGLDYYAASDDTAAVPGQNNIPTQSTLFAVRKETGYHAAVIGSNVQPPDGPMVPGTGIAAFFLGPANSGLARFSFITSAAGVRCQNIKVLNFNLGGTNTAGAYDPAVVGQHGVDFKGVDGGTIGYGTIFDVWGDGINLAVDNPAGPGTHLDPRPPGFPGGHPCHNVYVHDVEIHHNGRQGISATSIIGGLVERINMHDTPRTGIDMEPPTLNPVIDFTIRWSTFNRIGSGFVSFASYPTGNNVYFDTVTIDGNTVDNVAFRLNNTAPAATAVRWKNITIINNVDAGGVPFGYSDGANGYAIGLNQVDHAVVTGNSQSMQVRNPLMFFVHATKTLDAQVHDNNIVVGATWVSHHAYALHDQVYDGIGNSYYCFTPHNSGNPGAAGSQPPIGANYTSFWRSLQSDIDDFPFGFANLTSASVLTATGTTVTPATPTGTAVLSSESDLIAVGVATAFGSAQLTSSSVLRAVGVATNPPSFGSAQLVSQSVLQARGKATRTGTTFPTNEWRTGTSAARGPGWDEAGWDTNPWDGRG